MNESPLYVRTYDLMLWIIPQLQKFPRAHRFGLVERIQSICMDFQDALVAAGKSKGEERHAWLRKADIYLEQLRFWVRFARDLQLISVRQFEHVSRMMTEIGRLLGAWLKKF
jgi:hypothetical protein